MNANALSDFSHGDDFGKLPLPKEEDIKAIFQPYEYYHNSNLTHANLIIRQKIFLQKALHLYNDYLASTYYPDVQCAIEKNVKIFIILERINLLF